MKQNTLIMLSQSVMTQLIMVFTHEITGRWDTCHLVYSVYCFQRLRRDLSMSPTSVEFMPF